MVKKDQGIDKGAGAPEAGRTEGAARHAEPQAPAGKPGQASQPTRGFVMPKGRLGAERQIKKAKTGSMSAQKTTAMPPVAPQRPQAAAPASPRSEAAPAAPQPTQAFAAPQHTQAMPSLDGAAAPAGAVPPAGPAGYKPAFQVNAEPPKKKGRGLKIFGITLAAIVGVLALVYFVGVFVFMGRFFPHTTIIGMDISGKTPEEVHQMFDDIMGDYSFKVEGPGLNLTLRATDMGMSLDSQSIADDLLSEMNPWAWPYEVFQRHDDTDDLISTLENSKLADTLTAAVEEANAKGTAPKNATVAYDGDADAYVVVPEEEGNTLLADVVIDEVTRGTVNFAPKVTLSDAVLARPTVTRDDPSLAQARDEANKYLGGALTLTLGGAEKMSISADDIAEHITLGDDLSVSFDPEPLVAEVKEQVNVMDTTGATRTYTRPDGKEITVKGGDYGWITDSQATADAVREALTSGSGGTMAITMKQNAAQAPDEAGRDFGTRYIDVDLTEQHARLYGDDGAVIWESDIVSGKPSDGRDTPQGTYYVKTNDGKSVLRGYKPDGTKDYETEVEYWMPFKDNSVGFHDAGWQPTFGGDWYVENGSHGCINLPPDKAKELHEVIEVGDVVIVHE
ncbi:L,D-transpeptidase family protein [uncultured Adlercreutzia sp.]|uniref:L,D-transpeptidase family protein n=1 Tax=uncultured Adlercreutzia sp. TaxID=875803 RepID=UPI0025E81382|nr:L,D-transpeptidase family protein [uncultured Adlercreutzia sp.]